MENKPKPDIYTAMTTAHVLVPEVFGVGTKFHWTTFRHYDLIGTDQGDSEDDFIWMLNIHTPGMDFEKAAALLKELDDKWWFKLDAETRRVVLSITNWG